MKLDLVMPLRVPVTVESSPHSLQWMFAPRLNIDIDNVGGHAGWNFGAGVGPVFAADRFHEYFYSVPARSRRRTGPNTAPTAATRARTCSLPFRSDFRSTG